MKTIIIIVVYFILLLMLSGSKIKTSWIIWIAFMVGYSADIIANFVIKHLS